MDKKKIDIEVELTFEDFLRNIFWQTFKKVWFIFLLALILSPLAIFGIYTMILSGKFSVLIFLPLLPIFAVLASLYGIYSSAKKASEITKHKIQWSFSEDGYENFTPIGKSEISWKGIEEIAETTKDFLLFPQKPIFIIIPKRFFAEAQIIDFRGIVQRNLGDKAKLKN